MLSELDYLSVRAHSCDWKDVVAFLFSIKDLAATHFPNLFLSKKNETGLVVVTTPECH